MLAKEIQSCILRVRNIPVGQWQHPVTSSLGTKENFHWLLFGMREPCDSVITVISLPAR